MEIEKLEFARVMWLRSLSQMATLQEVAFKKIDEKLIGYIEQHAGIKLKLPFNRRTTRILRRKKITLCKQVGTPGPGEISKVWIQQGDKLLGHKISLVMKLIDNKVNFEVIELD